ncbi:MAG: DVUA0089 family protein [Pirellulaceae bacterium]|nr:DVUA0089 family protein [Pirellulaceae bacterium]
MAIRRSQKWVHRSRRQRDSKDHGEQRHLRRRMLLESLEARQLLAVGPQLVGIQPNDGEILREGDVRVVAPRDLTFHFQDGADIDPATLDAIQVTRSGSDGQFSAATAVSDLNTNGQVVFEFAARSLGQGGNGLSIEFTKTDRPGSGLPLLEVNGRTISVDLNTRLGSQTRASELLNAMNADPEVSALIQTRILRGSPNVVVSTPAINYSPLVLDGANSASVSTNFNTISELQVTFTAVEAGQNGNGLRIVVTSSNHGIADPPRITVDEREITIDLNTFPGGPTTAQQVVDAVNADPEASLLVRAAVTVGNRNTVIGTRPINYSPLILTGASDIVLQPGAFFLESNGREVVFRFAENLPDDVYRIDIFGSGATVLQDTAGLPFNEGENFSLEFELDLGPQVLSVVPQPVVRNALGRLEQRRNQIVVYFNDDDLDPTSAQSPRFYKLLLTRDTVETTDDVVFLPRSVSYDPDTDRAVLTFDSDLDLLIDPRTNAAIGAATFRLRIGPDEGTLVQDPVTGLTAEVVALPPTSSVLAADAGSTFDTALTLGLNLVLQATGAGFAEGQTLAVTSDAGTTVVLELDSGLLMNLPASGAGAGGIQDGDSFTINDGARVVRFEFDTNGIPSGSGVLIPFTGFESAAQMAVLIRNAINAENLALTATVISGNRVHLGGVPGQSVTQSGAIIITGQPGVQAGRVAVRFVPDASFAPLQMAGALAAAINGADFGVEASVQSNRLDERVDLTRVALSGASSAAPGGTLLGLKVESLQSLTIRSEITSSSYNLEFPGSPEEPGHRDIPVQSHTSLGPDQDPRIATRFYNFQNNYGLAPNGSAPLNAITENQKNRAREIFDFYSHYLGIQFVESENLGYTIATGDLRVINPLVPTGPGGVLGLNQMGADGVSGLAVMDAGELNWDDRFGRTDVPGAVSWFEVAMQQIGQLLGLGNTNELPGLTITGSEPLLNLGNTPEAVYPGDHDIVHGQLLYRPDNIDIDLFRVVVPGPGVLTVETFAERQANPSLLDTAITVYRELVDFNGDVVGREVVARNDDYYSEDSFVELQLSAGGVYYVGVSASGNNVYDPTIADSGLGGTSEGAYELRVDFQRNPGATIVDRDRQASPLDGDNDGLAGGVHNYWFRSQTTANTIYVDRANVPAVGQPAPNGTLGNPFNNVQVALALASSRPGSIVRIVGNGGADGLLETPEDNLSYEIGFSRVNGLPLRDGSTMEIPREVTVMIDAGAVFKLRRARIGVGSSSASTTADRSGAALQVLGTPRLVNAAGDLIVDETGAVLPGSVYFTSIHDDDLGVDTNPDLSEPIPRGGDWGGIVLRNDIDRADRNRPDAEANGIFLNHINHADFRYGGGSVVIGGTAQVISPFHLVDARPTISYNSIQFSADAAMSANPDSFEETNFHAPPFQGVPFTSDYDRVGPDIHNNRIRGNSLNALFVRIQTPAGGLLEEMTVAGRFDDIDVVHAIQQNLVIASTPGGPVLETASPPVSLVRLTSVAGGTLPAGEIFNYRLVFVDPAGNEGPPSASTRDVTVSAGQGSVRLDGLPPVTAGFVARRLYRSQPGGAGPYSLVAELNPASGAFTDVGNTQRAILQEFFDNDAMPLEARPRLDGRLAIDPGVIVKLEGSRIETRIGAQFIAEGVDGYEVVFTSMQDDRYGAGGTFDTSGNGDTAVLPQAGDWGGLYVGHLASFSLDHGLIAFGGGVTNMNGTFATFNPLEIHQATARVAHTEFEQNADGTGGQAGAQRFGRGSNGDAVIFVRGAQPIIYANRIHDNEAAAININANSMNHQMVTDWGRSTYRRSGSLNALVTQIDLVAGADDNQGPLVRDNRLGRNELNGMRVRGATLTTQSVWDDTSIAHVLLDEQIVIPDFHTFGGLRLESNGSESLVVKMEGPAAGFRALGRPLDIDDRIGGSLQVIGTERHPVILTSLRDDTATAGLDIDGLPQGDTNGDSAPGGMGLLPTGPEVDNGILIDNDVAVGIPGQFEVLPGNGGSIFSSNVTAQGNTQLFTNQDWIFDFTNFVDVGTNGNAIDLAASTITMPPTLIADDLVVSEGTFTGANGLVRWRAETRLDDGVAIVYNTVTFSSDQPLGNLQFINYLDEDVQGISDDLLYLVGTPGQPDFRAFTLDDPERIGFSHAGFYQPGPELANATYDGWAADQFADLLFIIQGAGTTYSIPGNIDLVDLPLFTDPVLGDVYGLNDVTTAFAWTVDPQATSARITSFLELVPRDPSLAVSVGRPGDWGEVAIDAYAHDRNVDVTVEREPRDVELGPDSNQSVEAAQFLGQLATSEKASDDTLRLGFELHGVLNRPSDRDVYSFRAAAGTEVWLDIDRSTHSLDTVVELLDGNGEILALSDNSLDETVNPALLMNDPSLPGNHVNPLQKSVYQLKDYGGTNPRDAGMRVVLPGTPGQVTTYHVRVRSSNLRPGDDRSRLWDAAHVGAGLTQGQYQLQIRLRELDEVPGTTVQFADVRFATNGIRVAGQPVHTPLGGEASEAPADNDTIAAGGVQDLGNLLNSDRGTLGVAGSIGDGGLNGSDVDFYRFEITYDSVAATGGHFPVVFDLDYADSPLGRANTVLSIFDTNGNLVFTSNDSNVAEDRPGPLRGANLDDLSRGSVGTQDAFLGTVQLPVGEYFLAISSDAQAPVEMQQFLIANPANPLLRLEPVNSLVRIAEDHIDFIGGSTAELPTVPVLLEPAGIVPFHLGDVKLFVSRDTGLQNDVTQLLTVDPFTGAVETVVGTFAQDVGDIAMRQDGNLFAFTLDLEDNGFPTCFNLVESVCPGTSDAETGNFIQIDTGNAASAAINDDGIQTFNLDPANPTNVVASNPVGANRIGHGIHFQATTFGAPGGSNLSLYAVGNRPANEFTNAPGVTTLTNALYRFDRNTGIASSVPQGDRTGNARVAGAGTQIVERGELVTDADPFGTAGSVLVAAEATLIEPLTGATIFNIQDGTTFTIDHDGIPATPGKVFEFNTGPEVVFRHEPDNGIFVQDGDRFFLNTLPFEFNTGAVVIVSANSGAEFNDGDLLLLTDNQGRSRTFEFDRNGVWGGNNEQIRFTFGMNQAVLVQQVIDAINAAQNFNVVAEAAAGSNRITLRNDSPVQTATFQRVNANGPGIRIFGDPISSGTATIQVEETFTSQEFANAILLAFNGSAGPPFVPGVPGITASADGNRLNFSGANFGEFFAGMSNPNVFTDQGSNGTVTPGNFAINFLAADTAAQIAARMTAALNAFNPTPPDMQRIMATQNDKIVNLAAPSVAEAADLPIQVAGAAPGGLITGIAFLGARMFAVSDAGGLFEVFGYDGGGAVADYIESSAADLLGIDFQGLVAGPANVEGGAYANLLFGIDSAGEIFAFNSQGVLQPVFFDSRTSIQTGLGNVNGLSFSPADQNLWQVGNFGRQFDAGHGLNPSPDLSRPNGTAGGLSLHFGTGGATNNYNVPGGAHGSVETLPFSLAGYSSDDQPMLYFNYLLDTENANSNLSDNTIMRDSFRVYLIQDDGTAHLLATNNSVRTGGTEFDDFIPEDGITVDVQELFDIGDNNAPNSWRQARVSLGPFAGQSNMRLRFDFDTSGDSNLGDQFTKGEELRAIAGNRLRDGQTFEIDSTVFEFDLGYTLVVPTGANIVDGQTFSIDGQSFEFDNGSGPPVPTGVVAVPFSADQSAARVAQSIEAAFLADFTSPIQTPSLAETSQAQRNDTFAMATNSRLTGGFEIMGRFVSGQLEGIGGRIGDNPNLVTLADRGKDVDMLRMQLNARDRIVIDIDTTDTSEVDTILRLFDAAGNQIAFSDDDAAPGEFLTTDSFLDFTVPSAGTYFLGISGFGNQTYNPTVEGSGTSNSTMTFPSDTTYSILIEVTNEGGVTRRDGNRLGLPDADSVIVNAPTLILEGLPGTVGESVSVHSGMTDVEVAAVIRQSLADAFAGGNASVIKTSREVVRVIGHTVVDQGPLGLTNFLLGDIFGNFNSNLGGQDNAHEGVYVDDIIIGFAERGEMATGAGGFSAFSANPLVDPTDILVGPYQVEVRRGASFGTSLGTALQLDRAFDTNDRLVQQHSLLAPRADQIAHRQTFTLSDGIDTLTFEYIDVNIGGLPAPGNVGIFFDPSENDSSPEADFVMAAKIRDAINSPAVQAVLDIRAALSDGAASGGTSTSRQINLFGNVVADLLSPSLVITQTTTDGNLLRDALLGPADGLVLPVGDAFFDGSDVSAGLFQGGFNSIGIEAGIVLSTGSVFSAEAPNQADLSSGLAAEVGDPDLEAEFGFSTFDRTVLQFTINMPAGGDLAFDFVFASEEYNEGVNTEFNDVFAFFVDGQNVALVPNTTTPISVNTVNGGGPVLGDNPANPEFYHNNDPSDDGGFLSLFGMDGFTDVFTAIASGLAPGMHTIKLAISDVSSVDAMDQLGDTAVFIQPRGVTRPQSLNQIAGIRYDDQGDQNHFRDQGQIVIRNNRISNVSQVGIMVEPGDRDIRTLAPLSGLLPHSGPVRNLRELNTEMLVPGVTVTNNIVNSAGGVGIQFAGEPTPPTGDAGPVPFGRIINNTIIGGGQSIGIQVLNNASPTVLNNIVAGAAVGLDIDATSLTTVVGGMLYAQNGSNFSNANLGAGDSPLFAPSINSLFVDAASGNFYPAVGSLAIDSAFDSLEDRPALLTVKNPLGIAPSPVLAPEFDALGQMRVDDETVDTPSGQGQDVFKDRGAIDRSDFTGPTTIMIYPRDNDAAGNDQNPLETFVEINAILNRFSIQLIDGLAPNDPANGSGINDDSVSGSKVTVYRDGVKLTEGVEYRFAYDRVANVIHLTPIAGIWESNRQYDIKLANTDGFVIQAPDVDTLLDGEQFTVTDDLGNTELFEFESGYQLLVPQTFQLEVPKSGGAGLQDGGLFTISDGGLTVTFEFDSNGVVGQNTTVIDFTAGDTFQQVTDAIIEALEDANLQLEPADLGQGVIHLGSQAFHTVQVGTSNLVLTGVAGGVADGDSFFIDDGLTQRVVFEFDEDGRTTVQDSVGIDFQFRETNEQLADKIVQAVLAANLGLNPTHFGDGQIHVGGTRLHLLDASTSNLVQLGLPGVQPAFGLRIPTLAGDPVGILDQQMFTIFRGAQSRTFELDDDGIATPGNEIVPFEDDSTTNELAAAIVAAINRANLGLTPVHIGGGIINLGGDATHALDLTLSPLTQVGQPGVPGAVPINYLPNEEFFSTDQLAAAIAVAINGSTTLEDVVATSTGSEVFLTGVTAINGVVSTSIPGIEDLAGNAMKSNRLNGETAFTVFVGQGLDWGDAPDLPYPTLSARLGPSHLIVPGFTLGDLINSEFDGQPNATASGDGATDDGVTFTTEIYPAYSATMRVTANGISVNRAGFLDAWIDFNGDGDWNDAGERVANSLALSNGVNFIDFNVPSTARVGQTVGRFRLSTTGGLGTTGPAADGEVEDHLVTISQNPWQNGQNRLDVNADTKVTPIDVLLVVNRINTSGAGPLDPNASDPPPYLDVNGDGFLAPSDANVVITHLNAQVGNSAGEGELARMVGTGAGAGTAEAAQGSPSDVWTRDVSPYEAALVWTGLTGRSSVPQTDGPLAAGERTAVEIPFRLAPRLTVVQLQQVEQQLARQAALRELEDVTDELLDPVADGWSEPADTGGHDDYFADLGQI